MKKRYLNIFIMVALLVLFIPCGVSAKKALFKCDYNVIIIPKSKKQSEVSFPLTATVYDNNTANFVNAGHQMKDGSKIYLSKKKTHGNVSISIDTKGYAKKATAGGQYSCPTLTLDISGQTFYKLYNEDYGNRSGVGEYMFVTKGKDPILEKGSQDSDKVIKVTNSCTKEVTKMNSIQFNTKVTFKTFSNGKKQYCLKIDNYDESCADITSGDSSLYFAKGLDGYTFYIKEEQSKKIFDNNLKCPETIYIYYDASSTTGTKNYYFTTNKQEALDNNVDDQYQQLDDPSSDDNEYNEGTDVYGCEVVPEEVQKWIRISLNFVKYIALVLVVVLGTIDFIKAAGSGEPDAMKKSGQTFIKRVVAVIILFLLPMIVELILHLINLYGSTDDCFNVLK